MKKYSILSGGATLVCLLQKTLVVEAFHPSSARHGIFQQQQQLQQELPSIGFVASTSLQSTTTAPETSRCRSGSSVVILQDDELEIPLPPPPSPTYRQELPLIQIALAGSLTTFFADLSMHPIDCIKTLQQSDLGMNWSLLQSAHYLYDAQGVSGFFRGFLTYATCDALAGCLKFGAWETWKKKFGDTQLGLLLLGAGLSFVASSILVVPGELVKQQLQMAQYDGLWEAVQGIASSDSGLRSFYAGYDGVLYRDIPYTMMELGLYDVFKRIVGNVRSKETSSDSDSLGDELLCAAMTGAFVALATTPMDVVKTKLMVDHYASFGEAFLATLHNHGFGALFSGVVARISWIVPFTCIYLPTYDRLKEELLKRHNQQILFLNEET